MLQPGSGREQLAALYVQAPRESRAAVLTALYFGYGVRGGPVDVGEATARSMAVGIVGVTFISTIGTLIFWGANPRIPVG